MYKRPSAGSKPVFQINNSTKRAILELAGLKMEEGRPKTEDGRKKIKIN
jgi:hypothetical protein